LRLDPASGLGLVSARKLCEPLPPALISRAGVDGGLVACVGLAFGSVVGVAVPSRVGVGLGVAVGLPFCSGVAVAAVCVATTGLAFGCALGLGLDHSAGCRAGA